MKYLHSHLSRGDAQRKGWLQTALVRRLVQRIDVTGLLGGCEC